MAKDRLTTNILLIKPGAIGDLLQLTPAIRALAVRFPGAKITLLVGSRTTAALFQYSSYIAETLVFDRKGEHRPLRSFLRLWLRLRRNRYDLVVHFQRSNLKAWFLALAAIRARILVYHKPKKRIVHVVDNYLETLAPLGIAGADRRLELTTGREEDLFAEKLFQEHHLNNRQVIALNPGASHAVNRWSVRKFASLADELATDPSHAIIVVGGPEDRDLAESLSCESVVAKPIILTGTLTLLQLGAVLKRCAVLVSGDTGPLHLATAVGTRVVGLFGAADPARTGPVGTGNRVVRASQVPCVPCRQRSCSHERPLACMDNIAIRDVVDAVTGIMKTPYGQ